MKSRIATLLNIQYPIIQAAMTWLTSSELVAAVSNAGGLGVLGPNAGQTEIEYDFNKNAEKIREEIRKTKAITDKNFAINYFIPIHGNSKSFGYAEMILKIMLEEDVHIAIVVSYGDNSDFSYIKKLKDKGIIVLYREISPTVCSSIKAEKMGVDSIIITGYEAGGYLSQHQTSTLVLLSQVLMSVKIPVIAAGGIYNYLTAKSAFSMGAEAVYMGTRFINTLENPASFNCKNAIISSRSEDLLIVKTDFGDARLIAKKDKNGNMLQFSDDYIESFRTSMLLNDPSNSFICVSESAGGIHNIVSCQSLIHEVMGIQE